jgi:hypothetical protein
MWGKRGENETESPSLDGEGNREEMGHPGLAGLSSTRPGPDGRKHRGDYHHQRGPQPTPTPTRTPGLPQ